MGLGDNIRYLRIKKGFSQDYIAEKLGYKSYTTIQKWESGVSEPPVKKLRELSILLDADMDDMTNKNLQVVDYEKIIPDVDEYYINKETANMAQKIFENKELRMLFDTAQNAAPEDLETVHNMLLALKRKERDHND